MITKNLIGTVCSAGLLVAAMAGAACAEMIHAFQVSGGIANVDLPFTLGWEFTVDRDIYVQQLGVFDVKGDGQADAQRVRIYNKTADTIVTTAAVSSTAVPELAGAYNAYYQNITPVKLSPGVTYIVAAENVNARDFAYAATVTKAPDIHWGQGVATPVGAPAMPEHASGFTIFRSSDFCYFGPDLKYAYVVPEPSSAALFGAAGLLLLAWRRYFACTCGSIENPVP